MDRDASTGLPPKQVDAWTSANVHFLDRPVEAVLGGGGGATAYLLGRLGQRVTVNTKVGTDLFGSVLRHWLESTGVKLIGPAAATTAMNIIALSPDSRRRSLYYTGEKVEWARSLAGRGARWFYASGYGQVTSDDLSALIEVFETLRGRGTKIAFDPSPWFFAEASRDEMMRAWAQVDGLIGTESELSTWRRYEHVEELAEQILNAGPAWVVIKRGRRGAAFAGRAEGVACLPTEQVNRTNTVGAGDTFNAGLLHGLCQGESLAEAVRIGLRLATHAVRQGRGVLGALE